MTVQLDSTTTCPRWCAGKHDDLGEPSMRVHVRAVGGQGVEITAEERNSVTDAAQVYVPDMVTDRPMRPASASTVRHRVPET